MSDFYLRLLASDGEFFSGRAEGVILKTIDGECELQAHHEQAIVAVEVGILQYKPVGEDWHRVFVGVGIAQFSNNRCTILVDTCELPEEIDAARARRAAERAQEEMRQKKSIEEYKMAQASLARALMRLQETSRHMR